MALIWWGGAGAGEETEKSRALLKEGLDLYTERAGGLNFRWGFASEILCRFLPYENLPICLSAEGVSETIS